MTIEQEPAGPVRDFRGDVERVAPLAWLCLSIVLSLRGLWQQWLLTFEFGLPDGVMTYVYADMASGILNLLLGLYVFALGLSKSPRFRAAYTLWAVVLISAAVAFQAATFIVPAFIQTLQTWLVLAATVAVTLWTVHIVRRPGTLPGNAPRSRIASVAAIVINGFLGLVIGGALGAAVGLLAGSLMVDWLDISCFEGGCGYAAAAVGLAGLGLGMIAGTVFALVRSRRPAP